MVDTVLQEQSAPYRIDENGIPIKPGYRKPFTSETAKIAAAKSVNARVTTKRALQILKQFEQLLERQKRTSKKQIRSTQPTNKDSSQVKPEPSEIAPINPATGKPLL